MKIYTLWSGADVDTDDCPYIVDAVDEYTIEAHCGFPPAYAKRRAQVEYRELIIDVPEKAVRALFEAVACEATAAGESRCEETCPACKSWGPPEGGHRRGNIAEEAIDAAVGFADGGARNPTRAIQNLEELRVKIGEVNR